METSTAMMTDLREGCIAHVIGLTSPRDACRLALISTDFKSAADSDAVWDNFLPADISEILSHSDYSKIQTKSKELFFTLCDPPILFGDGNMSFSLDKWSGKKCYMIAARRLRIGWGGEWVALRESRFKEMLKMRAVCWLEIRGRIETRMLSPLTIYKAYLVYKWDANYFKIDWSVVGRVSVRTYGFDYESPGLRELTADVKSNVFLVPQREVPIRKLNRMPNRNEAKFPNEGRGNGWLEVELGEFHCQGDEADEELEMTCCEIRSGRWKNGLIVQGIEIRPAVRN